MMERPGEDGTERPPFVDPWATWPDHPDEGPRPTHHPHPASSGGRAPGWLARPRLAAVALGLFVAAIAYRYVVLGSFNSWTIFFHGLPAILAVALALIPAREATPGGRVFMGTAYALVLSATVAGEGSICIVIAAPFIFLMVGLITALLRWIDPRRGRPKTLGVALPVVLLASLASGVSEPGPTTVTAVIVVDADPATVADRLATAPVVPPVERGLLAMGFPQPIGGSGGGLAIGDHHRVDFDDGGTLTLEVVERTERSVTFEAVEDTTMIGQWITWTTATFAWEPVAATATGAATGTGTEVTLELTSRRLLQPGWYFGPIVEAGADRAADHLLVSRVG